MASFPCFRRRATEVVTIPGSAPGPGCTDVRRHARFADALATHHFDDVRTLYGAFQHGLRTSPRGPCMGTRVLDADGTAGAFAWLSYEEAQALVDAAGSGMLDLGLAPRDAQGHRLVGLFSKNRYEWVVVEQACHAFGMADVPLYDTLGAEAITHILAETGVATVFCDRAGVAKLLAARAAGSNLANIVCYDSWDDGCTAAARNAGVTLRTFSDVLDVGRATPSPHTPPLPSDLAFICYTSGTTGLPKGAMISHANQVADAACAYSSGLNLTARDVHLSYLPLAHIFERLLETAAWTAGAAVGFYQGETLKIMDDLKALRPTVFPSVPRLFNRVHDKVLAGVEAAGGLKAALFRFGFAEKRVWLEATNSLHHSLWDPLVFRPIAKRAGLDRVRLMISGSAPIAPHVMQFLRVVFSTTVLEGYGQTECSAAATLSSLSDQASLGHVGAPLACNEIMLVSVPEMGYLASDTTHGRVVEDDGTVIIPGIQCAGRGEVCVRGPNVFSGYFKDPVRTAEAIDVQGWLHTGDVGVFDELGNLRIVDRKKNIFKLSQGEYVAAEKIENIYAKSLLVGQIFVYGDSLHAVLVAIVVPDADAATLWAKHAGSGAETLNLAQLCERNDFKAAVEQDMAKFATEAKLQSFEKVKAIHLDSHVWTPDNLLTPSFKLKRADAKKKYLSIIDKLYFTLGDSVGGKHMLRQR